MLILEEEMFTVSGWKLCLQFCWIFNFCRNLFLIPISYVRAQNILLLRAALKLDIPNRLIRLALWQPLLCCYFKLIPGASIGEGASQQGHKASKAFGLACQSPSLHADIPQNCGSAATFRNNHFFFKLCTLNIQSVLARVLSWSFTYLQFLHI